MAFDPWTNPVGTHTGPWSFSRALDCLKAGGRVRRRSWNLFMLKAGIVVRGDNFAFASSPTFVCPLGPHDLLADDWEMVPDATKDGG